MRMPNLNGLRVFEAAARLLSMKDAAAELHVSPSAVSQLVRTLERELGRDLFDRAERRLALTGAGRTLLPAARAGFRLIGEAAERIRSEPEGGLLTISATAFFAETWLLPRLPDFTKAHPEIDVHVATGMGLANLAAGDADVAIRHGLGVYAGMQSDLLLAPAVVPVAAAALAAARGRPKSAAALIDWPLLHDADRGGWALWFARHHVEGAALARGLSFDDTGLLRAATLAGQGVALLPEPLIAAPVAAGELIVVGPAAALGDLAYYLVAPNAALARPKVAAFRSWIKDMIAAPGSATVPVAPLAAHKRKP